MAAVTALLFRLNLPGIFLPQIETKLTSYNYVVFTEHSLIFIALQASVYSIACDTNFLRKTDSLLVSRQGNNLKNQRL